MGKKQGNGFGRRAAFGLLLLLLGTATNGQAQQIRGRVLSAVGSPLPQANIRIETLGLGAASDADGRFALANLAPGSYTLVISYVGFLTATRTVELGNETVELTIVLLADVIETGEVEIIAAHDRSADLTRSSLSVSALSPEALEDVRGQTLGETLGNLPGVRTLTTGPSIVKPVVRGLHSQRLLLLNAGVPQEGQQWGGEHAPEIDPFAPVQVEVIKGAAGVEYGVGAIGGVIRIEPRALPSQGGIGGQVGLNAFSNSRQGAGSLMLEGHAERLNHLAWRVQGSLRRAGDARTPGYVIGNSAFREQNGSAAVGYHLPHVGVDVYASRFSTELGIYQGAHINNIADLLRAIERGQPSVSYDFGYAIEAPKQRVVHDLVSIKTHFGLPARHQLDVNYGYQRNQRQEFDAHRGSEAAAFDLVLQTHSAEAKFTHRPVGRFFGVVGVSGMNQGNVNGAAGLLIPNFRALTGGVFARETMVLERWTVDAGVRVDHRWLRAWPWDAGQDAFVRRIHTYSSISGVAGAIYRFTPMWSLAANVGTGWRPPGVSELYSDGVHHGTATFEVGDATLGSERSLDVNLTLRHVGARLNLEASAYRNAIDDFIFLLPDPTPTVTIRGVFPTFHYEQADAVLTGFDGTVQLQANAWLGLGLTASVLRAENRATDAPLFGMPADRLQLHTRFGLPGQGLLEEGEVALDATFVGRQDRVPDGFDYTKPPDGYALFSLSYRTWIRWDRFSARASLGVDNLFDTVYRDYLSRLRYFIDAPGRNITFRLQVPFGRFES